ncbi:MAG: DUF1416 domain-containing protein [Actinomycetota bacterium]
MCGSTVGGLSTEGIDVSKETVIQGTVSRGGAPAAGAYVRLLDAGAEFTAEVQTSATGGYRFFAAPGTWTLRALARGGAVGEASVSAEPGINDVDVVVSAG